MKRRNPTCCSKLLNNYIARVTRKEANFKIRQNTLRTY